MKRFADKNVAEVFRRYPAELRARLMALRELIFDVAAGTEGVGPLRETLKWGQPSYLTDKIPGSTYVATELGTVVPNVPLPRPRPDKPSDVASDD